MPKKQPEPEHVVVLPTECVIYVDGLKQGTIFGISKRLIYEISQVFHRKGDPFVVATIFGIVFFLFFSFWF